jgi:hypothetical protein
MRTARAFVIPKSDETRREAIETIIERLGITKAAFFIRENISDKVDYLKLKQEMFGKRTASELYSEIKKMTRR